MCEYMYCKTSSCFENLNWILFFLFIIFDRSIYFCICNEQGKNIGINNFHIRNVHKYSKRRRDDRYYDQDVLASKKNKNFLLNKNIKNVCTCRLPHIQHLSKRTSHFFNIKVCRCSVICDGIADTKIFTYINTTFYFKTYSMYIYMLSFVHILMLREKVAKSKKKVNMRKKMTHE